MREARPPAGDQPQRADADPGATLLHDLNQPLTAIALYLQAIRLVAARRGEALPPDIETLLGKAEAEAERAGSLVRRLAGAPPDRSR